VKKVKKVEVVQQEAVQQEAVEDRATLLAAARQKIAEGKREEAEALAKPAPYLAVAVSLAKPIYLSPADVDRWQEKITIGLGNLGLEVADVVLKADHLAGKGVVRQQGPHVWPNPGISEKATFWALSSEGEALEEVDGVHLPAKIGDWKKKVAPKSAGINNWYRLLSGLWLVYRPDGKVEKAVVKPPPSFKGYHLPGKPPEAVLAFLQEG